jgi:1-acyl-sn-glycerol-3-phosphate acyltransferase
MNAWVLLSIAILLLCLPRALLSRTSERSPRPEPEIRGRLVFFHWLVMGYCGLMHRLKTNGWAPLPESGPALLIANHTCGIDHLVLQAGCRRVLGFMIAKEYYDSPLIHPACKLVGCIPVNRDGRDLQATRAAIRVLREGRVLPIFPEGKITPSSGRELGELLPGAAFIAVRAGVPVIPAYIRGTPETNQIGPSLTTPSRAHVTFGDPIDLSEFNPHQANDKAVLSEVSRRFQRAFMQLRERSFDGHAPFTPDQPSDS